MKWKKSKFQGVRYREHATRKHGVGPDRYYTIFYKLDGKMVQEALGWASESWTEIDSSGNEKKVSWTEKRAAAVIAELKKNQSLGISPRTLKEKRAMKQKEAARQKAESLTLSEFWEQDYIHLLKTRIKESSWKKEVTYYEKRLGPQLGHKALKTITQEDIEQMVVKMRSEGLTPRTQEYAVGTFFRIWKHASSRKLVKPGDNPAMGIQIQKVNNTRTRVITAAELKLILDSLKPINETVHDLSIFCAYTGCRFSEAANLRYEHINSERSTVLFLETKNRDSREVHVDEKIMNILLKRAEKRVGAFVFTKNNGTPFSEPPSTFKNVVDKLGLNEGRGPRDKLTMHSLRHTAATLTERNGAGVKDLQLIFGWKTPAMVFRYAKGNERARREAMKGLAKTLSHGKDKEEVT